MPQVVIVQIFGVRLLFSSSIPGRTGILFQDEVLVMQWCHPANFKSPGSRWLNRGQTFLTRLLLHLYQMLPLLLHLLHCLS